MFSTRDPNGNPYDADLDEVIDSLIDPEPSSLLQHQNLQEPAPEPNHQRFRFLCQVVEVLLDAAPREVRRAAAERLLAAHHTAGTK